jgi:hypothetical protein
LSRRIFATYKIVHANRPKWETICKPVEAVKLFGIKQGERDQGRKSSVPEPPVFD